MVVTRHEGWAISGRLHHFFDFGHDRAACGVWHPDRSDLKTHKRKPLVKVCSKCSRLKTKKPRQRSLAGVAQEARRERAREAREQLHREDRLNSTQKWAQRLSKTIWVTGDGERISVRQMQTTHLRSAIRWLRYNAFELRMIMVKSAFLFQSMKQTDDEFLLSYIPTYWEMLREAQRRRLFRLKDY